jgi:hypothetical protein
MRITKTVDTVIQAVSPLFGIGVAAAAGAAASAAAGAATVTAGLASVAVESARTMLAPKSKPRPSSEVNIIFFIIRFLNVYQNLEA